MFNGVNHTTFEDFIHDLTNIMIQFFPDQSREEDTANSLTWYYSPWPHLDDEEANRYQLAMVRGYIISTKNYNMVGRWHQINEVANRFNVINVGVWLRSNL